MGIDALYDSLAVSELFSCVGECGAVFPVQCTDSDSQFIVGIIGIVGIVGYCWVLLSVVMFSPLAEYKWVMISFTLTLNI